MKDNPRKPNLIIIHHSLSVWGDGKAIVEWHTRPKPAGNGWKHPGYHVVIGNGHPTYGTRNMYAPDADGRADRILSEDKVANGAKGFNAHALHVCLIGNFDAASPTQNQVLVLAGLVRHWMREYGVPVMRVWGHREAQIRRGNRHPKTCPGENFNMDSFRLRLKEGD